METYMNLILLTGLCCLSLCASQPHYSLFLVPKTWKQAQSYCRERGGDLATFYDLRGMEKLLQNIEGKYDNAVWIGLNKGKTLKWHWSLADKDMYKEGEKDYLLWSFQSVDNCAVYSEGKLHQLQCPFQNRFICFDATKKGVDQYILSSSKMNWTAARDFCRKHYTDLTSLRNAAEYQTVSDVAKGHAVSTGIFRDPWVWSDKANSSLRYWRAKQEVWAVLAANCVALLKEESGKWGDLDCAEAHPFLCMGTKQQVFKMRISLKDATLDPNNFFILNSILEQMKQKLGGQDVHLHWKENAEGKIFTKESAKRDPEEDK
ncbi:macrophage mannose receptor 1-like [Menidia menidia]